MSPAVRRHHRGSAGFPRVSGDEPETYPRPESLTEFSPRERG